MLARERLPLRDAAAIFAADQRLVFAVPDGDWTYVGTTDTRDGGDVDDVTVSEADVEYLLDAVSSSFAATVSRGDVAGAWAGWRPLIRSAEDDPSDIPREDAIEMTAPGFLTVAGGKLTTYRSMAAEAVDRALAALGHPHVASGTALRPLVPAAADGAGPPRDAPPAMVARVRELFGPGAYEVFARWREAPPTREPMGAVFPYSAAEVERAAREMVGSLADLVDRRLSALPEGLPLDPATLERVARAAAPVLGWSEARIAEEVAAFASPSPAI